MSDPTKYALRRGGAGLALLLTVLAGAGCGHGTTEGPRTAKERLPRMEVVHPLRTALQRRVELAAMVEPLRRVDLCARVPGVVEHLPAEVDIGRKVKAGEVLLRLAVPDLEADRQHKEALREQVGKQATLAEEARTVAEREVTEAQKQEKRYEADRAFQQLRHDRVQELVRRGAQDRQLAEETRRQLDTAEAALEAARAQVATRRARVRAAAADLEVARRKVEVAEAEVRRLDTMIGFATVRAPFDGVITRRWVDRGATIKDPAAVLLTVMQIDRMRVLIDVPQRDVVFMNSREQNPNPDGEGDAVSLQLPALADVVPGGKVMGCVTRTGKALDPVTRTMRAEIELDNAAGYLHPGMYGTATVLLEQRYGVLTIPATALVRGSGGKVQVYHVADAQGDPPRGELQRLDVELGLDDGRLVEIRHGLTGTEWVVLRGNGVMRAEDRVIAIPEREP